MNNKQKAPRPNILVEDDKPPSIRKPEEDDPLSLAGESLRSLLTTSTLTTSPRIPEKKTDSGFPPSENNHKNKSLSEKILPPYFR